MCYNSQIQTFSPTKHPLLWLAAPVPAGVSSTKEIIHALKMLKHSKQGFYVKGVSECTKNLGGGKCLIKLHASCKFHIKYVRA